MNGESIEAMRKEARRIEEDCVYSAKGHFESSSIWETWNLGIGVPAALLGALAGVSAFRDAVIWAGTLAMLSASATALLTFLKPSHRAAEHHKSGTQYNSLKNRSRMFREVDTVADDASVGGLRDHLADLSEQRNALNEVSPQILNRAFIKARKGILEGEAAYSVDGDK